MATRVLSVCLFLAICSFLCVPCESQILHPPEGCLDCWYEVCAEQISDFNDFDYKQRCCYCIEGEPVDLDKVDGACTTDLQRYRNTSSSAVSADCCPDAKEMYLSYDTLEEDPDFVLPPATCDQNISDFFFGDPQNIDISQATGTLQLLSEYLLPQYVFSCTGCIEQFLMIVDFGISTQPVTHSGSVTLQLWKAYESSLRRQNKFYERDGTTKFMANPELQPIDDKWLLNFTVPPGDSLCFEPGHILGFSLADHDSLKGRMAVAMVEDSNRTFAVEDPPYMECDLNDLFEAPSQGENLLPWAAIKISIPQTMASSSVNPVTSTTTSLQSSHAPTPTSSVGTRPPQPSASLPLAAIAGGAGGGVLVVVVVILAIILYFVYKRKTSSQFRVAGAGKGNPNEMGLSMNTITVSREGGIHRIRSRRMESMVNARQPTLSATNPMVGTLHPIYDQPPESPTGPQTNPLLQASVQSQQDHTYHILEGPPRPAQREGVDSEPSRSQVNTEPLQEESKYMTMHPNGSFSHLRERSIDSSVLQSVSEITASSSLTELDNFPVVAPNYDVPTPLSKRKPPMTNSPLTGSPAIATHLYHELEPPIMPDQAMDPQLLMTQEYDLPTALFRTPPPSRKKYRSNSQPQEVGPPEYHVLEDPKERSYNSSRGQPMYHELEPQGSRQGRSHSLVPIDGRHIYDTGIYVPSRVERLEGIPEAQGKMTMSAYNHWSKKMHRQSTKKRGFFTDDPYWEPETQEWDLYDQLSKKKYREILRNQIQIVEHIGSGQFGSVVKATWSFLGGTREVAAKIMRPSMLEGAQVKFLQEAAIMGQFFHPNVIKLLGVVTVGEPLMIVTELMPFGDLSSYLSNSYGPDHLPNPGDFLNFCRQIACGMKYLVNKSFVHRDLAARNILLNESLVCKISDFGMSRGLRECDIYHSRGGQVPIKWTAPEALIFKKYSEKSDVFSYGIVLYEIWSVGRKPFPYKNAQDVISLVQKGYCHPPPPGCPREIYGLMVQCWDPKENHRPKFDGIVEYLTASDVSLLSWSSQDTALSPRVMELGAPLSESEDLFKDLQNTYCSDDED